jgi:hypothetical protein
MANGAGPASQETIAAEDRVGVLWDVYRKLRAGGWDLDTKFYSTCFRLASKAGQDAQAAVSDLPAGAPSTCCGMRKCSQEGSMPTCACRQYVSTQQRL